MQTAALNVPEAGAACRPAAPCADVRCCGLIHWRAVADAGTPRLGGVRERPVASCGLKGCEGSGRAALRRGRGGAVRPAASNRGGAVRRPAPRRGPCPDGVPAPAPVLAARGRRAGSGRVPARVAGKRVAVVVAAEVARGGPVVAAAGRGRRGGRQRRGGSSARAGRRTRDAISRASRGSGAAVPSRAERGRDGCRAGLFDRDGEEPRLTSGCCAAAIGTS